MPLVNPGITQLGAFMLTAVAAFSGVQEGGRIPAFTLPSSDGGTFESQKDLRSAANVVVFCRVDQEYTERLLRDIQSLCDEKKGESICVAAIFSGDADPAKLADLKSRLNLRIPFLLDKERSVYGAFEVIVAPATGFVDANGTLRYYYANYRRDFGAVARANVDCLLGKISDAEREQRVEPSVTTPATSTPALSWYRLGMQLLKSGDLDGAEKELRQAWEGEPKLADAGVELGFILLQERKDQDALKVLDEVVRMAPDDSKAAGGRGVALIRTGNEEVGKKLLEDALAKSPRAPLLYLEMGRWCEVHGVESDAMKYYKMGLEQALSSPSSR